MTGRNLAEGAQAILLDFDGPVCSIFAGLPAPDIADRLKEILRRHGLSVDDGIRTERDPLQVLSYASQVTTNEIVIQIDTALRDAELDAARTAEPTRDAGSFIQWVHKQGKSLVIVSNNSEPAIGEYLRLHDLEQHVTGIVGRSFGRPDRMKPDPWPVRHALALVQVNPHECVLIGDSTTDIAAARAADIRGIGLANKPAKLVTLADAGADAIITSMMDLLAEPL